MASETMHTLTMARALELLDANPKQWSKATPADLAKQALADVKTRVAMTQQLEQAIDEAIVADKGAS